MAGVIMALWIIVIITIFPLIATIGLVVVMLITAATKKKPNE